MGITPFEPKNMNDLLGRFDELNAVAEEMINDPDSLRGEVLDLIYQCEGLVPFDTLGKLHIRDSKWLVNEGKLQLSLAKLYLALDPHALR